MSALPRIEIDGHPATAADLAFPAVFNYGHLTVMQVRDGRTRGLDLHLERLDAANRELYGTGLDGDLVRDRIRHALGDVRDASVRLSAFQPDDRTSLMAVVRPPSEPPGEPQSLMSVEYQRPLAHIKHTGTFGQIHFGRAAEREGFDDALLTGPGGVVSEGALTNLGCYDGTTVTWPDAPCLIGITMQLVSTALGVPSRRAPVHLTDLPSYASVFVTNSRGVAPVGRVDDRSLPVDEAFMATLTRAYEDVPWDVI
jgi:branched-subunit amino acid aminotransferase/4-amino-4-deoxychorismate lyase